MLYARVENLFIDTSWMNMEAFFDPMEQEQAKFRSYGDQWYASAK